MVCQVYAAPRALRHIAALGTQQLAAASPAVQEQDALLPRSNVFCQFLLQRAADDGAVSGTQLLPQVGDTDLRQGTAVVALRQLQQIVLSLLRVVKRLHRGRGRAQQQPRALGGAAVFCHIPGVITGCVFRLIGPLLLLIHDDEAQVLQRRKHRRPGAQHDMGLAPPQPLELIVALRHPQTAVQQRYLAAEVGGEACHHLGRQSDLRYQDHHGPAHFQQLLRQSDIHHRLAAAGNAAQQRDAGRPRPHLGQQRVTDALLLSIQCQVLSLYSVSFFRYSVFFLLPVRHRPQLFQGIQCLAGYAGEICHIVQCRLAVLGQERHRLAPPLGLTGQSQRLLSRNSETGEQHYLVAYLAALLLFAVQCTRFGHAAQQRLNIIAQRLTQLIRGQRAILQKAAYRCLLSRGRQRRLGQGPGLPVMVPYGGRQHGSQRVIKRAEIPACHPQRQPQLPFRDDRLVVQQGPDRLQRLVRHRLMQREDHRLCEPVAAAEWHQHPAAYLSAGFLRQQVVIDLVNGVGSRLYGHLGDHRHLRPRLPR